MLATSMAFCALCAEAALRLVAPGEERTVDEAGDRTFDFFGHHEVLGWDLVPASSDRIDSAEFGFEIQISDEGLRSDRLYGAVPEPGVARVVVLGDSFTFGHGVQVEEGWVARVEARFAAGEPPIEMINLAVTGYGVDQMVLRLEERSTAAGNLAFAPDAVIAAIFIADVFRTTQDSQSGYRKPRFLLDSRAAPDGLRLIGVPVPPEAATASDVASGSRLLSWFGERMVPLAQHLGLGDAWQLTGALLSRLQRRVDEAGARLLVVLVPRDTAIAGGGPRQRLNRAAMAKLGSMSAARGISCLDLTEALARHAADHPEEPLYFPADGHWTPAGHAVAAEAVARWLPDQLPARPSAQPTGPEVP